MLHPVPPAAVSIFFFRVLDVICVRHVNAALLQPMNAEVRRQPGRKFTPNSRQKTAVWPRQHLCVSTEVSAFSGCKYQNYVVYVSQGLFELLAIPRTGCPNTFRSGYLDIADVHRPHDKKSAFSMHWRKQPWDGPLLRNRRPCSRCHTRMKTCISA